MVDSILSWLHPLIPRRGIGETLEVKTRLPITGHLLKKTAKKNKELGVGGASYSTKNIKASMSDRKVLLLWGYLSSTCSLRYENWPMSCSSNGLIQMYLF